MCAFDVAKAYNERKKKEEKNSNSTKPFDVAEAYKQRKYYESLDTSGVNNEYVNSFISDSNNFFGGVEKTYNSIGWDNASSVYDSTNNTIKELKTRGDTINAWLYKNKDRLDEDTYNNLSKSLSDIYSGYDSVVGSFDNTKQFYSQFETKDDYNQWKANEEWKAEMLGSEDFNEYSQKGVAKGKEKEFKWATTENGRLELFSNVHNSLVIAYREDPDLYLDYSYIGGNQIYGEEALKYAQHMTDDEYGIYTYLFGKDENEAEAYLKSIEDTVNRRQAGQIVDNIGDNGLLKAVFGVAAGLDQFATGVKNLPKFFTGEEADAISPIQYASGAIRESIDSPFWRGAYDLGVTTANMLPSILVGSVTGGVGGLATMGTSVLGNSYAEMRRLGYDEWQSRGYAVLVTAAEVGLQSALGGISSLGGSKSLSKLATNSINGVDNAIGRVALKLGANMLSEGVEEATQSVLEPIFKSIFTGEFEGVDWGEVAYSGLLGALSAGFLEGGTTIAGDINTTNTGKVVQNAGGTQRLTDLASDKSVFSADSVAYKLAGKVNEKTGAYTIGRLYQEVGATLSEQNKADIIAGLEAKGVPTKYAKKLAEQYQAFLNNEMNLTDEQVKVLEELDPLTATIREQLINKNLTSYQMLQQSVIGRDTDVYQRTRAYDDVLNLANEASGVTESTLPLSNAEIEKRASAAMDEFNADNSTYRSRLEAEQAKRFPMGESSSTTQTTPTQAYSVSVEGKTVRNSDGEEISIKGIASNNNGQLKLRLDNDEVIDAKDVSFATKEEGLLYDMVADLGVGLDTAKSIMDIFGKANTSIESYRSDAPLAYQYGTINYVKGLAELNLSEDQKSVLFGLGRKDAGLNVEARVEANKSKTVQKNVSQKGKVKKNGITYEWSDGAKENFKGIRNSSIKVAEFVAQVSNLDVHVYKSFKENGKLYAIIDGKKEENAPNGFFRKGNQIYLDINAGNAQEGVMLYTMSHEVGHYIRDWNAKAFKELGDFIFEHYDNTDNVDKEINRQIEKRKARYEAENNPIPSKMKLFDEAYEEVVCNALSKMFADPNTFTLFATELKKQNQTLWQKLGEAIKKFLDKVKNLLKVYSKQNPDSPSGRWVDSFDRKTFEQLQEMYVKAFVEADENFKSANTVESTTEHNEYKFQLRETLEETNELVAVHNMTQEQLLKSLDLGGLPMPSIAIIKAKDGHSEYGDVSLVFRKDTIDPEANSDNKVYGGDAWTPAYPKIEFKPNEKVEAKIREKYYSLAKKFSYDEARPLYNYANNLEDALNSYKSEEAIIKKLLDDTDMMQLYLLDIGKDKIETVQKETRTELSDAEVQQHEFFIKELGESVIDEIKAPEGGSIFNHRKEYVAKYGTQIEQAYRKLMTDVYKFSAEEVQNVINQETDYTLLKKIRDAYNYRQNGRVTVKTEADYSATRENIRNAVNSKQYQQWLTDLFKGVIEKSGIRNNKDYFDYYGNSRSWEALHWANNLNNVVRAMKQQNNGDVSFFSGLGIWGVSAKEYQSIDDIRADKDRLKRLSAEEYKAIKEGFGERLTEIATSIMSKSEDNYFIALDNAMECIVDAVRSSKTKSGILRNLKQYTQLSVTETAVSDIVSLVADISQMPTEYFEAKPQRAVGFEEVTTAIIPNNSSVELKEALKKQGVSIKEYQQGNSEDRLKALNSIENIKFSERDSDGNELSKEQQEFFKDSKVRDKDGNLMVVYHGTPNSGFFSVFEGDKLNDSARTSQIGQGFYFTNDKKVAQAYTKNQDIYTGKLSAGRNPYLYETYLNITNPFDVNKDTLDADKAKAVFMDGTYEWFFNNHIPFQLAAETINGQIYSQKTIQGMSKEEKVSLYVDYLMPLGSKEVLSNMVRAFGYEKQGELLASMKKRLGYDGILEEFKKGVYQYVALDSNQIKLTSNKTPTTNPDIRYSERDVKPLEKRVSGDNLLNAQDLIETVRGVGGIVDSNGYITLYHRTSEENAEKIRKTGFMSAKEDGLFFSTSIDGQAEGYGNTVVEFSIPAEKLVLDDLFDNEAHLRLPIKNGRTMIVSEYLVDTPVSTIKEGMTEAERYEVLKNKKIALTAKADNTKLESVLAKLEQNGENISYEEVKYRAKLKLFKKIGEEFGVFKEYSNKSINLSFEYSKTSFEESFEKQGDNYLRFAKMLTCFDDVIENAVGIEVHNRNSEGYKVDLTLKEVYVLASAFEDGNDIIPVKLEVKEFMDKKNTLYIAIALESINKDEIVGQGDTKNGVTQYPPSSDISLSDLLKNVNTSDKNFLKYIPDGFLNEGQRMAKQEALKKDAEKTDIKRSDRDLDLLEQKEKVIEVLAKETDKLKEDNQYLKELVKLQRKVTHGTIFTKSSVEIVAGRLVKSAGASGNKAELVKLLNDFYGYIAKAENLAWEDISDKAQPVIDWLKQNKVNRPAKLDAGAVALLKELRSKRIYLDKDQQSEAAYVYGSFYEFRKKAMGSLTIVNKNNPNGAKALESVWMELAEKYPAYFDSETISASMPARLLEIVDKLRSYQDDSTVYDYSEEMVYQDLLTQVYDSYWDVSTLHTAADSMQKEINLLKIKHRKKMTEVREYHNEKHNQLKKEYREKIARIKQDYREKNAQTTRELLNRWQESRERATENRRKTEMRHKIKKVVSDLNHLLLHGTKERNIKLGLQEAVASALEAVNMDTVSAESRIAKLQEELLKAKTPEKIAEIQHKIDYIRNLGENLADRLESLRKAYSEIKNSGDEISAQFKEEASLIHDRIERVIKDVGKTPLRDMSLEQLNQVYDMYTMVLTTIRNANGIWRDGKLEDLQQNASAVMQEVVTLKKSKNEEAKILSSIKEFSWNEMTPYYAFDRIGSPTFTKTYWDLLKGQNTYANDVNEAKEFSSATRKKYNYNKWNLDKVYEYKCKDGRTFKTTLKHMLSIYAYSKRDQAQLHMEIGGFFHNDKSTFRKGKFGLEHVRVDDIGYKVDVEMLEQIKQDLSKDQLKYVDEMQEYLTKMGEKGNEVTRLMWGIDIFKEKVYFPLKSDKDFIKSSNETAQSVSLKNDGMTKETVAGASNPIVLEAFDDVWASHVDRMSQYHGFVIPIDNLNKILHYGTWVGTDSMTVSKMIMGRFGRAAKEYLDQFIKDMNGNAVSQGIKNPFANFFTKFKKTAVGASLSTVIQQPTAILRAMAVIDPKYFIGKPNIAKVSSTWSEIKKYAPLAIIKEIGGFDAGGGKQAVSWLNSDTVRGKDKVLNTIDDIAMKGAEVADKLGWSSIWNAVKREVKASNPNLAVNSEAFLEKCGERFTEIIVKTQVYDSTLSRSGFMRSKSEFMKMLTAFMGEPTLSINMMFNAIIKAFRGGKGAKLQAIRTISSVYASIIAASAAASLIYALRDDDEDESYLEKYMQAFGGEFISDIVLAPVTSLPAVKDIVSIFQGWDVERSDMSVFKDLYNAFTSLDSENKSIYRKIEDLAGAMGAFFGVPTKNLLRTGRELFNLYRVTFDNISGGDIGGAFIEGITGKGKTKSEKLYEALVSGDYDQINRIKGRFKDESAYNSAIKSAIKEHFLSGDLDYNTAEQFLIEYGGLDEDEVYWKMQEWEYELENGTSDDYAKYNDFYTAVQSGKNLKAVINEYTEKGVEKSTLAAQITSHFKPLYKEMSNYERASIKGYLLNAYALLGYDRTKKSRDIDKWLED